MAEPMKSSIVVMGVAGAGKTCVGRALAQHLGMGFADGDDYHDPASVAKMSRGEPLTDADRRPWLDRLNALLRDAGRDRRPLVLACSALRRAFRRRLAADLDPPPTFVFLDIEPAEATRRLAHRTDHFMPADLIASQFAALEPPKPDEAIHVDATQSIDEIVRLTTAALGEPPQMNKNEHG